MHSSVYMSIPISQFFPPPLFPLLNISLFSTSVTLFLFCKFVHLYHFFYSTYKWYHMIYLFFSLWLHSVWQSLGPSTLLQMTLFRSFLWLSNISLYICTTSSLSIPLSNICCFKLTSSWSFVTAAAFCCLSSPSCPTLAPSSHPSHLSPLPGLLPPTLSPQSGPHLQPWGSF